MKKFTRIITITGTIITMLAASVSFSCAASTGTYIKVGLEYGSAAPDSITVSADGGLMLCSAADGKISKENKTLDGYDSVTLKKTSSGVTVTDSNGNTIVKLKGNGSECIASASVLDSGKPVTAGKNQYMGGIIPYLNSSSQMNIINYVEIEDYLKGLLAAEMSPSYQAEALKAQAVTARSFAMAKSGAHSSQGFSVCSTTHCQVYGGVSKEYSSTNKAVDDTKGLLMYYKGSPVAGYYFSNSGGHTENAEDVWGSEIGYVKGVADPYSPDYNWTVKIKRSEIYDALSSKGIGCVESVTIDKVNDSGYVASLTVHGSRSSYTVTRDSIRSMFGSGHTLKSRVFTLSTDGGTISGTEGGASTVIPASGSWYAAGSSGTVKLGSDPYVLSSAGTARLSLDGLTVLNGSGNKSVIRYTPEQTVPAASAGTTVTFNSDDDVLIFNGKGYGHGAGMSQEGANEMAKQGKTYMDILNYYYTDIEVK